MLNNWKLKDPKLPLTLDNLSVIWSFTKSKAEEWFYLIHVVIESFGANAMKAIKIITHQAMIIDSSSFEDRPTLMKTIQNQLQILSDSMKKINDVVTKLS